LHLLSLLLAFCSPKSSCIVLLKQFKILFILSLLYLWTYPVGSFKVVLYFIFFHFIGAMFLIFLPILYYFIYLFFVYLFTCAYIVWVISPPYSPPLFPPSPVSPSPPQFQAGSILPLSLSLLKKRHKHNKKDKAI
jgi:hypothetical protein